MVDLLALAVVAGGTIGASAASTTEGDVFRADLRMPSNAPLSFIEVYGVPQGAAALTISNANFQGIVDTDGSGKIEGAGFERITYGVFAVVIDTNTVPPTANTVLIPTAHSDYNVSVSGRISTKNNLPSVQESLKGAGYSSARTNTILDGTNGTIVISKSPTSGSSSFNVNYTGNNALVVFSNSPSDLTFHLFGHYKGTIRPGIKAIKNGDTIQVNEEADLRVNREVITDLDFQVVKLGNRFWANGLNPPVNEFNGSGSISSNGKVTANFKGFGSSSGSSLKLTGQQADLTVIIIGVSTNAVSFIGSADISGKISGQTVSAKGVTAVPVSLP
jgi:hypothetical protein